MRIVMPPILIFCIWKRNMDMCRCCYKGNGVFAHCKWVWLCAGVWRSWFKQHTISRARGSLHLYGTIAAIHLAPKCNELPDHSWTDVLSNNTEALLFELRFSASRIVMQGRCELDLFGLGYKQVRIWQSGGEGGYRNTYEGLVAKIKGKRSLTRTECRWNSNFKIGFTGVLINP